MSEEMKKVNEKIELQDEELNQVAGGYSRETWKSMTYEERVRAKQQSDAYRVLNMYCAMDDRNI